MFVAKASALDEISNIVWYEGFLPLGVLSRYLIKENVSNPPL